MEVVQDLKIQMLPPYLVNLQLCHGLLEGWRVDRMCMEIHDANNAKTFLDGALASLPAANTKERKEVAFYEVELAFSLCDFLNAISLFLCLFWVMNRIDKLDIPELNRVELRCLVYLHTEKQKEVCSLVESIETPSQTLLEYWAISLIQLVLIGFCIEL